jgi:hypothetical protein
MKLSELKEGDKFMLATVGRIYIFLWKKTDFVAMFKDGSDLKVKHFKEDCEVNLCGHVKPTTLVKDMFN